MSTPRVRYAVVERRGKRLRFVRHTIATLDDARMVRLARGTLRSEQAKENGWEVEHTHEIWKFVE